MAVPRFWRKLKHRYNLLGTHCTTCNTYYYPPRNMCPQCRRGGNIQQHQFIGKGRLVTYTVIHTAPDNSAVQTPYVLGIVQLDEGPRLTSQIICKPEEASIGMKVKSVFRKLGEDSERGMIYYGTKFTPA
jgi:hypothetical protein